jgi:hypothetical protein
MQMHLVRQTDVSDLTFATTDVASVQPRGIIIELNQFAWRVLTSGAVIAFFNRIHRDRTLTARHLI